MLRGLISRVLRSAFRSAPGPARPGQVNNHAATLTPSEKPRWRWAAQRQPDEPEGSGTAPFQQGQQEATQPELAHPPGLLEDLSKALKLLEEQQKLQGDPLGLKSNYPLHVSGSSPNKSDDPSEAQLEYEQQHPLNVSAHIDCIQHVIGYTFKDHDLVRAAIFKGGRKFKGMELARGVQLHLALIGDKILEINSYSENFQSGGKESHWRAIMSNLALDYCIRRTGLVQMLADSGHAERLLTDGRKGYGTMAEAIMGAIYEDSGRDGQVTQAATAKLLGTSLKINELMHFVEAHHDNFPLPERMGRRLRTIYTKRQLAARARLPVRRSSHVLSNFTHKRQTKLGSSGGKSPALGVGQEGGVMEKLLQWTGQVRALQAEQIPITPPRRTVRPRDRASRSRPLISAKSKAEVERHIARLRASQKSLEDRARRGKSIAKLQRVQTGLARAEEHLKLLDQGI